MSSEKDYSVLPEVTIIQESAKIESEEHKPKKLRVCAYARVSTEKEEQEYCPTKKSKSSSSAE